jgi:drug/metabolite transporter (DMT)-like permease
LLSVDYFKSPRYIKDTPVAPSPTQAVPTAPSLGSIPAWRGYGFGLIGVLIFSLTLPMTRVAVQALDPLLLGLGRALLAALPAALWLAATRSRRPTAGEWRALGLAAIGIVLGWPLASTYALQSVPSSHAAVVNGLLPLSTALFAAWRSHERLAPAFWACAVAGAAIVIGFALAEGGGALQVGDLWLLLSVVLGGMGYAEGARAARTLGGARTICWVLVASAPFLVAPVLVLAARLPALPPATVLAACAYLAFGSMFLGFFAWYRGLAEGGIARVGQVQLLQPFLTVSAAALLFGESVRLATFACAGAVIIVIALGRRAAQPRPAAEPAIAATALAPLAAASTLTRPAP